MSAYLDVVLFLAIMGLLYLGVLSRYGVLAYRARERRERRERAARMSDPQGASYGQAGRSDPDVSSQISES